MRGLKRAHGITTPAVRRTTQGTASVQNPKPGGDGYCAHCAITYTEGPFPLVGWGTVEDRTAIIRDIGGRR